MGFVTEIREHIQDLNLLQHPFYRDWMEGRLSLDMLRDYAKQYTPFVDAFPRLVSSVHSLCEDPADRRELLRNLMDEEGESEESAHPTLWRNFAQGLGSNESGAAIAERAEAVRLREKFLALSRSSYEEGLCALYAYEHQIPAIAGAKIQGLVERYGISSKEALQFFAVHKEADVYHSKACEEMLEKIPPHAREKSLRAARAAAEALWDFLTEVHSA